MQRLNPKTGLPFKYGTIREDGYIFKSYIKNIVRKNTGFFKECWLSPNSFANMRISQKEIAKTEKSLSQARKTNKRNYDKLMSSKDGQIILALRRLKSKAKHSQLPFDLDIEYLAAIAPDICPVLKVNLAWGEQNKMPVYNAPSVDKIIPNLGYVKGNVQWMSYLANAMKQNASPKQLHEFADWVKATIPNE